MYLGCPKGPRLTILNRGRMTSERDTLEESWALNDATRSRGNVGSA